LEGHEIEPTPPDGGTDGRPHGSLGAHERAPAGSPMKRMFAALCPLLIVLIAASCNVESTPDADDPVDPGMETASPIVSPRPIGGSDCMLRCMRNNCREDPYCSHNCRCLCFPPRPPGRCYFW
jgi:hypothetical protein